jgi:hypothetical protein
MSDKEITGPQIDAAMRQLQGRGDDEDPNPNQPKMQEIADAQMESPEFTSFTLQGCARYFSGTDVIDLMRYAFTHGVMVGLILCREQEPENGHTN